jgi:predicted DNA-binding ribbon-helix-helix protein
MARAHNKRSLTIARHRTSVSLEDEFWDALNDVARSEGKSVAALIGEIDQRRSELQGGSRVFRPRSVSMCWSGRAARVEARSALMGRRYLCPSSTRQGPHHEVRSEAGVVGLRYADAAAQPLRRQLPLAVLPDFQPNRAPVTAAGALPAQQPSGQQAARSQARQFRWAGQRAVKAQARQFRLAALLALDHWFRQTAVTQVAFAHRSLQGAPAAAHWPGRPKRERCHRSRAAQALRRAPLSEVVPH